MRWCQTGKMGQREVKLKLGEIIEIYCTNRRIKKNKIIYESNKAVTEENAIIFFYDEN